MARLNLSSKIILLVLLVSIISASFIFYLGIREQNKFFKKINLDKALYLATSLDASISKQEDLRNKEKLLANIQKHIYLNPDILMININLPNSDELKVAVSSDENLVGTSSGAENEQSYKRDAIISNPVQINGVEALKVITPIHVDDKMVGTYEIILTLRSSNKAIAEQNNKFITITLGSLFLLIVFLLAVLGQIVVSPIKELSKGMEMIRGGNLEHKVKIKSNDEIGDLGEDFNKMAEDLDRYKKGSELKKEELEQKVKERTAEVSEMKEKYRNLAQSMSKAWLKTKEK